MNGTVYQFKPWARLAGDPQEVGELLEVIRDAHGTLSPLIVVEEAKPEGSPLHRYFAWDDTVAAAKYREVQASHLLRSVVAVHIEGMNLAAPTRAFVSVRQAQIDAESDDAGSYTSIAEAVRVVDYRKQLIEAAMRELESYRAKYQLLSHLAGWDSSLIAVRKVLEKEIETESALVTV